MAHRLISTIPSHLHDGSGEDKGDSARLQAFIGAIAVGDLIKSTLGPRGMDKILQPLPGEGPRDEATVTNDGATILKNIWLDNPAAKILVNISKTQDQQCGDGTTSVVVLAAELLRVAERLVQNKIHPQLVIQGYRRALVVAKKRLAEIAFGGDVDDEQFRENLVRIAKTTLSSKLLKYEKEHFAELAVDAVLRLRGKPQLDYIQVIKKAGASLRESYLDEGFILEKRIGTGMPKVIENCKIMIANSPMDYDKIKMYGARVKVDSLEGMREIELAEKEKMKKKVENICAHGCNVFINRQLIYNYPEEIFKNNNVVAIEHADFEGTESLAAVLGADIVSTFNTPDSVTLGRCDKIEEVMIGEDKVIRFSGCHSNEACTIVLRGASTHVLDEAERSLHDALAVLYQTVSEEKRCVYGGGCAETEMAQAIMEAHALEDGKHALAVEAFAKALLQIPLILAENSGYDAQSLVSKLKAAHAKGETDAGLNCFQGGSIESMKDLGIFESYRSKYNQLCAATEAAEQILRVDNVIHNAPRERRGM